MYACAPSYLAQVSEYHADDAPKRAAGLSPVGKADRARSATWTVNTASSCPRRCSTPAAAFRMADELLETYIKQLLESHRAPEVTVAWQGGEPTLMGLDFFKRSVELRREI